MCQYEKDDIPLEQTYRSASEAITVVEAEWLDSADIDAFGTMKVLPDTEPWEYKRVKMENKL